MGFSDVFALARILSEVCAPYVPLIATVSSVASFCVSSYTLTKLQREKREVKIVAVDSVTKEEKLLAIRRASDVSRAEILGIASNAAGGRRDLDTSLFRFNEKFKRRAEFLCPPQVTPN